MSVVKLAPPRPVQEEMRADAVRILQEHLDLAKAGQIEELIIICKNANGTWSDEHTGTLQMGQAIGWLEIIKQGWIQSFLKCEKHD